MGGENPKEWNENLARLISGDVARARTMGYTPIVAGDFNGHLGDREYLGIRGAQTEWNSNGRIAAEFAVGNNLEIVNLKQGSVGQVDTTGCRILNNARPGHDPQKLRYL